MPFRRFRTFHVSLSAFDFEGDLFFFYSFIKKTQLGFTVITARALVLTLEKHRHMCLSNVIFMQISLA